MPPNNNKIKLQKIVPLEEEDFVTPDDLIKISESLIGIINRERTRTDALMADEAGEKGEMMLNINAKLDEKEKQLRHLISELGRSYADNDDIISARFSKEVKRLEKKIPSKTDLTEIYNDIQSLKDGLHSFPTELTINNQAVRDGLELLEGDERLDKSAISGLEEWYAEILTLASKKNIVAGARLLRYMADVAIDSITDGQTLIWNATLGRFEPGTGGSGGITVATPTGTVNGINTFFTVTSIPKWVDTDTGHYYENFGYIRSTFGITMDLAPNTFIRAVS